MSKKDSEVWIDKKVLRKHLGYRSQPPLRLVFDRDADETEESHGTGDDARPEPENPNGKHTSSPA